MTQAHDPDQQIAERYFLGELTDAEAEAFEAHYFECPGCAEYVVEEQMLFDAGRAVAREQKPEPVPAPVAVPAARPLPAAWRWRQWVPAAAAAMLLFTNGLTFVMRSPVGQQVSIQRVEPKTVKFSLNRAETDALTFKVGEVILFEVVIPEKASEGDQAGIRNAETNELMASAITLTQADIEDEGPFLLQPRALPAGRYQVVIERVDGNRRTRIATQPFEVRR